MTFGELKTLSNHIAFALHSKVEGISPIAVFMSSKVDVVVSDLGIILASLFFMNLDVGTPIDRIQQIIFQTAPAVILVDKRMSHALEELLMIIWFLKISLILKWILETLFSKT